MQKSKTKFTLSNQIINPKNEVLWWTNICLNNNKGPSFYKKKWNYRPTKQEISTIMIIIPYIEIFKSIIIWGKKVINPNRAPVHLLTPKHNTYPYPLQLKKKNRQLPKSTPKPGLCHTDNSELHTLGHPPYKHDNLQQNIL